ncbi:MAG: GTP-binding protein [Gammaproteobacteria bacterium]|nr:GTP-binding protein [Gammaproteobacteria bacterium]
MRTSALERIPVTLIGGYLGAGKTSLLRHLLAHATGERIAVLVNDFGSLGLDAALVARSDAETVTLTNGCVCCSIADDFGAALDAQVRSAVPPARIVVETSGVAEPGKTARYASGWPGVRLDAVLTVVDLETIRTQARDRFVGALVERQIASADLVVANKSDRVAASARRSTVEWLVRRAPRAALVETTHGRVAPAIALGLGMHEPGRPPDPRGAERPPEEGAGHVHTDGVLSTTDHVEVPFARITCRTPQPLDRTALAAILDTLPNEVVRFKGLVRLQERPDRPCVLQGVGRRWSLDPAPAHVSVHLGIDDESVIDVIGIGPTGPIESAARNIMSIPESSTQPAGTR